MISRANPEIFPVADPQEKVSEQQTTPLTLVDRGLKGPKERAQSP